MQMSRSMRLVGAVVLACSSVPWLGVGPAHADTALLVPTNSAYFYSAGLDKPEASPAAPPNVTGAADGVGAGHLAVAATGGKEDKVSFLYFDVFSLPAGASVTKAVVTMKLVPASPEDLSAQASPDKVVACKAGEQGFNGDDGAGLAANAPDRLCKDFSVKGTAVGTTAYAWDVTPLAQTWIEGANDGLAFTRADESPNSSFQVVFDLATTAALSVEYSLPEVVAPIEEVPVLTPPVDLPPTDPGSGFAPAPDVGVAPETGAEVPIVPNPTVNEPPSAVPAASVPTRRAAVQASLRPTTGFWLTLLALGVGLGLLSLVLGDPRVATTGVGPRSRLSRALELQQRLGAPAPLRGRPV